MASAAVQEIIDDSQCAVCTGGTLYQTLEVGLLVRILSALGVTMSQAEIMAEATCFTCLGMPLAQAVALVLLNEISATVTGGGGGSVSPNISGAGSPVGVVTPSAINQFYRDTTGIALWQATGLTSADWLQWI